MCVSVYYSATAKHSLFVCRDYGYNFSFQLRLVQEMIQQWETTEKTQREVVVWCSAARAALQSPKTVKKTLAQQLLYAEKLTKEADAKEALVNTEVNKLTVGTLSRYQRESFRVEIFCSHPISFYPEIIKGFRR